MINWRAIFARCITLAMEIRVFPGATPPNIAAENTAQANIDEAKADLEQKKFDFDRAQALYNSQLIAKQDFDAKKAAYDVAVATLAQRQAALAQAKAQTDSQRAHLDQAMASQRANYDALDKTISRAPFDGLVTNVPVREGETVVVGIQNSEGSTLMTLADMSVITAEVKVDETDIVNMQLGQRRRHRRRTPRPHLQRPRHRSRRPGPAPHHRHRHVAVHHRHRRGQGLQSRRHSRPDARQPPRRAPPGLSTTAKITVAQKPNVLTIPIQALVQRDPAVEKTLADNNGKMPATVVTAAATSTKPEPVQGVYILTTPAENSTSTSSQSPPASPAPPTSKSSPASRRATKSSPAATRSCAPSRAAPPSSATTPPPPPPTPPQPPRYAVILNVVKDP